MIFIDIMKNKDWKLFVAVVLLSSFGLIMIYSASSIWAMYKYNDAFKYVRSQFIFLLVGIVVMKFVSNIEYRFWERKSNLILLICLILLGLVLIPGIGSIRNGSRSWFGIGSLGIQPSEFAKLGLIIYTAKYLSHNHKYDKVAFKQIIPLFVVILFSFALIMLEPDFGTGMVITLTLILMIFISGLNYSFFVKLGFVGLLGIIGLIIVAPYRMARITSYLNPWNDPLGSGFQIIQSLYAIGPGGLLGQGFLSSRQKQFYLPEPQTDFIFSIISEEFGFLGVLIVSFFLFLIFYHIIKISLRQTNLFAKYLSAGIGITLILQSVLNISVVIGLIPVTGVTLPFLSYGGSSLLVSMIAIGIVLSICKTE